MGEVHLGTGLDEDVSKSIQGSQGLCQFTTPLVIWMLNSKIDDNADARDWSGCPGKSPGSRIPSYDEVEEV